MLITVVLLGKFLECAAKGKTSAAIKVRFNVLLTFLLTLLCALLLHLLLNLAGSPTACPAAAAARIWRVQCF
jgi:hypothetical protein